MDTDALTAADYLAASYGVHLREDSSRVKLARWFRRHLAATGGRIDEEAVRKVLGRLHDRESGVDLRLMRRVRATISAASYAYDDFQASLEREASRGGLVTATARPLTRARSPRRAATRATRRTQSRATSSDDSPLPSALDASEAA